MQITMVKEERLAPSIGFKYDAAAFYGIQYQFSRKIMISSEYTADLMSREKSFKKAVSPWNLGVAYQINDYLGLSAQYLHGNQVSVTGQVSFNPGKPPLLGGKDLAPVPMRLRGKDALVVQINNETIIRKVLAADQFEIRELDIQKRQCYRCNNQYEV